MKVLVLGARGRTGRLIVSEIYRQGHEATAIVREARNTRSFAGRLRIFKGNVLDPEIVDLAMRGQDAVIYAVGSSISFRGVTLFSESTRILIACMKKHQVRRLTAITGVGAGDSAGHGGFLYDKILRPVLLRTVYEDKNRQEEMIRASGLEWMIVRPGALTDGKATRDYGVFTDLTDVNNARISRADVAEFCVSQLTSDEFLRQAPLLSY